MDMDIFSKFDPLMKSLFLIPSEIRQFFVVHFFTQPILFFFVHLIVVNLNTSFISSGYNYLILLYHNNAISLIAHLGHRIKLGRISDDQ